MRYSRFLPAVTTVLPLGLALSCSSATPAHAVASKWGPYESVLERIAADIEQLKADYPQLADFSAAVHHDRDRLVIAYDYKTHQAPRQGGWTSGVPNPDEDGVWFYIDVHSPDSQRQIHTQPRVTAYRYQKKRVTFLILEGERTPSLSAAIVQILRANGVVELNGEVASSKWDKLAPHVSFGSPVTRPT